MEKKKRQKVNKKIKQLKRLKIIKSFQKQIKKHHKKIWCPNINIKYKKVKQNKTWFNIDSGKASIKNTYELNKMELPEEYVKCKKIRLFLTSPQKKIIEKWMMSYTEMYNKTLKLIKKRRALGETTIINFMQLRTNFLKNDKHQIIDFYKNNKKETVKAHILDYAIKLACSNYKSAITNLKRSNIKHFRIRYWRHNRNNKIMDIENQYFKKEGLCFKLFGKIKAIYDKKPFDLGTINITCKLLHDKLNNKYYLFVPEKGISKSNLRKNKIISCDPGIRTFLMGISENKTVKIGDGCSNKIKKYLNLIDARNKLEIPKKIKKKNERICNKKIKGLVEELHWKSIRYLTKNYKKILIGDLSVKGITNKKTSNINKMTKRIAYKLSFYKFRQRLEYKCQATKTQYETVDESYTSKICSMCGNLKNDLGSSKIYNCSNCKIIMDRDVNGARGILIKSLKK